MPRITSYRHGVPAWTDVSSPDIEGTGAFYCALFDWEMSADMGPDAGGYRLFTKDGGNVAGIGPVMEGPPSWSTYINVDDIDDVAGRIAGLGGTLAVPPMDLPNESGRIAFGIDPTGGFFGLHQAGANHIGAAVVNEPGSVVWSELNTRDTDAATSFYNALLGWTTTPMDMDGSPDPYLLVNVQGRAVAGVMKMGDQFPPEVPTNWLTYFAVDGTQEAVDKASALGGGVVAPPFDTPVGVMAVLHDPTGAVFAIGTMVGVEDPNAWPD